MAALSAFSSMEDAAHLQRLKADAICSFAARENEHAYSSPLLLRHLLEKQGSEQVEHEASSHTMLLLPQQTYENEDGCFLSILCAECRNHFHIKTNEGRHRTLNDSKHPGHMFLPIPPDSFADGLDDQEYEQYICAVEDCYCTVRLSVMPPKLTPELVSKLHDDARMIRNLHQARVEDPQRYQDVPDTWAAKSAIPTLIKYIEDRLAKPSGHVLRIKKRNKKFRVAFGDDLDDLLVSLGFEEQTDEDGEPCWIITEPEASEFDSHTPVFTRMAHIQDILEELRTFTTNSSTTPAWEKLMDTFPGFMPRREVDSMAARGLSQDDAALLGCLRDFSPQWFGWAAIFLAKLCPKRRDEFLDAGLRCIQNRDEDASLSIIMYKSQFDNVSLSPEVQAAFEFFGVSPDDDSSVPIILGRYRTMVEDDSSELFTATASHYLEVVSIHLGADLVGEIARGASLATGSRTPLPSRRMSIRTATQLLKIDADFSAELIKDFAANVDADVDRGKVAEALEVLSDLKKQQNQDSDAQSLKETADFVRATMHVTTGPPDQSLAVERPVTPDSNASRTTPPGLRNIGNTCYLNSLLQYFYNVKAVREMVLNYDQFQLDLDNDAVERRRTGGNGTRVTIEEAIVARQFIQELRLLFLELQVTTGDAATPSQKLANTALSSAKEILTSKSENEPPPLPARPSPAPPKEPVGSTFNPETFAEIPTLVRSTSSRTLVNELENSMVEAPPVEKQVVENGACPPTGQTGQLATEDRALSVTEHVEDIAMEDARPPSPYSLDQKIAEVSKRLEQSDRSGTSQQDVEEIIGNILEHLMRAIRPKGPLLGKPDLQSDEVTELFFTTIVNSTIRTKTGSEGGSPSEFPIHEHLLNEEVVPERWITAFPHPDKAHKMKTNMYEALDRYFSYELLSNGELARYTTIRALPPIVHICIQRSDASGVKNRNPVIIPEELYLDRYMEADTGSSLWNTRRRVWAIKERIKDLESRSKIDEVVIAPWSRSPEAQTAVGENDGKSESCGELLDLKSELWQDVLPRSKRNLETAQLAEPSESDPIKRRSVPRDADATSAKFADILWDAGRRADEADSKELDDLKKEQAAAFDSMKQHKYCLHAIICHSGGMNAGHYWVWVRDFKKQIWYKYNDSYVTEDSRESGQVVDQLNISGDPYYVAYVRDDLKDELVEVPQRVHRTDHNAGSTDVGEGAMEVIDGMAVDTPPQPANSPVNTGTEVTMADAAVPSIQFST